YLLFWDIDWTMYRSPILEDEEVARRFIRPELGKSYGIFVDKEYAIDEIEYGEIEHMRTPGLEEVMERIPQKSQGVVSNGNGLSQRKKLVGLGVEHLLNPDLIYISGECIEQHLEQLEAQGCELDPGTIKTVRLMWEKPGDLMFRHAQEKLGQQGINIPFENFVYVGDRYDDMSAIKGIGGRGIFVAFWTLDNINRNAHLRQMYEQGKLVPYVEDTLRVKREQLCDVMIQHNEIEVVADFIEACFGHL
ncbi:HAD hydrolase-like protein, partial [Candidatus Woesearchaeota archaeon]|nr:HAD hydrolase-like protein [Candidatus Woesearchaeota archaeon]